jgi:hypothetical protein
MQSFLGKFGAGTSHFILDRGQQLVMLGPILLTIGKNIQVEGYPGWLTCIQAFMGTLGLKSGGNIWLGKVYPSILCMIYLGTFLSASFLLRKELFRICRAAVSGQDRFSYLFKDVIGFLKGTSMTHVILIEPVSPVRRASLHQNASIQPSGYDRIMEIPFFTPCP